MNGAGTGMDRIRVIFSLTRVESGENLVALIPHVDLGAATSNSPDREVFRYYSESLQRDLATKDSIQ